MVTTHFPRRGAKIALVVLADRGRRLNRMIGDIVLREPAVGSRCRRFSHPVTLPSPRYPRFFDRVYSDRRFWSGVAIVSTNYFVRSREGWGYVRT